MKGKYVFSHKDEGVAGRRKVINVSQIGRWLMALKIGWHSSAWRPNISHEVETTEGNKNERIGLKAHAVDVVRTEHDLLAHRKLTLNDFFSSLPYNEGHDISRHPPSALAMVRNWHMVAAKLADPFDPDWEGI